MKHFFDQFPPPEFLQMSFFGLDITPKAVRVAELKRKGGHYVLGRYGERMLKTPVSSAEELSSSDELKKALQSLQREFKIEFVKVAISEEEAYLFKTDVETGTEEQVRTAIEFHLEENVPISGEETVFDYHIFRQKDHTHAEASVTVLPRKIIDQYITLLHECDLVPLSFLLESAALSRSLIKAGDMNAYLLVNLEETKTSISIVSDGAVQFSSTAAVGSDSFIASIAKEFQVSEEEAAKIKNEKGFMKEEQNESVFAALANTVSILNDEIERIYLYWHSHKDAEGQTGKKIEKIILAGKDTALAGFKDHLSQSLRIPVEIGNVWTNTASFDVHIPSMSQVDSLNYAAPIGLAIPKFS